MNKSECRENFFGFASKLTVVPDGAARFNLPFTTEKKVLEKSDFSYTADNVFEIPVRKRTVTYKESTALGMSGNSYKVQVDWDMETFLPGSSIQAEEICNKIKKNLNHLIITIVDNQKILVRNTEGASAFSYIDDKGIFKCSWTFHCVAGLQRIKVSA